MSDKTGMFSINALCGMLTDTPDLCAEFVPSGEYRLEIKLHPDFRIFLSLDAGDSTLSIERRKGKNIFVPLMHWHPAPEDAYETVCSIARRGNVMVIRDAFLCQSLLYLGPQAECPCLPNRKRFFGKTYFIKAK